MGEDGSCLNKKTKQLPVEHWFSWTVALSYPPLGFKHSVNTAKGSFLPCRTHRGNVRWVTTEQARKAQWKQYTSLVKGINPVVPGEEGQESWSQSKQVFEGRVSRRIITIISEWSGVFFWLMSGKTREGRDELTWRHKASNWAGAKAWLRMRKMRKARREKCRLWNLLNKFLLSIL